MVLKWTRTKPEPLKYFEQELNLNPNRYLKRFDTLLKIDWNAQFRRCVFLCLCGLFVFAFGGHRRYYFCAFVIAKSRLAPIKEVPILHLDLTAAVLAVRLNALVERELNFDVSQSYFWIGSTAVLLSILNISKRFPIFVANRLAIIEQSSQPSKWHILPSKLNAVDLKSRGLMDKPVDCLNSGLKGPQFLWTLKALWPQFPVKIDAQILKEFFLLKIPFFPTLWFWVVNGPTSSGPNPARTRKPL